MREILFRAKQHYTKEWLYGAVVKDGDECLIMVGEPDGLYKQKMTVVEESTVGQFTGLVDRNGKRIFEGDIMLLGDGTKRKTVIEYDSLRAQFVARLFDKNSIRMAVSFWSAGEIIGNIHDNPELLS